MQCQSMKGGVGLAWRCRVRDRVLLTWAQRPKSHHQLRIRPCTKAKKWTFLHLGTQLCCFTCHDVTRGRCVSERERRNSTSSTLYFKREVKRKIGIKRLKFILTPNRHRNRSCLQLPLPCGIEDERATE